MQKLKEILTQNIGLKLLAIGIAFVIWLVVVNISNPEVTSTKSVTVEVMNENVIEDVGKTYEINGPTTVTVSYTVRTRDAYLITASDFKAYADLENLYDVTGSVPITVEVVNHENLIVGTPVARPSVMHITVDDVVRKNFDIGVKVDGEVKDGYTLNSIDLTANSVLISGPKTLVEKVDYADVTIPVDGLDESIEGTVNIVLRNEEGTPVLLNESRIEMNRKTVGYYADIISGKNIPVSYGYTGTPAAGYRFTGLDVSTGSINVHGSRDALASVQAVSVPDTEVSIQDAVQNVTVQIDLNRFIPDNLSISGDPVVTVVAKIEPITEKLLTFDKSEVVLNGTGPGYNYEVSPDTIDVIVTGLAEELAATEKHNVRIMVDLSGRVPGEYILTPSFVVPENVGVKSYTSFMVKVSAPEPETLEMPESIENAEGETDVQIMNGERETDESTEEESETDTSEEGESAESAESIETAESQESDITETRQ